MKRALPAAVAALALLGAASTAQAAKSSVLQYVVAARDGAKASVVHDAIRRAGGTIVSEDRSLGLTTVHSGNASFIVDVSRSRAVSGAARDRAIGQAFRGKKRDAAEDDVVVRTTASPGDVVQEGSGPDPLSDFQWDMRMIGASPSGSYGVPGGQGKGVRVGIMDTGVDARHPDIAPNFDAGLSRNFTTDDPVIDGPCDSGTNADGTCVPDPPDIDQDGHGTHVASTIASPINGQGIAGVAPEADIVNIRAGQDSGYFFLNPTVEALHYAADNGIDVVNMSFYIDPWLYNCTNLREDSLASQIEQRTIIKETQDALDYAWAHGVTLISALGNEHTDLGDPKIDTTSPDYPGGTEYKRHVDNGCLNLPAEGDHVISVSSVGPSGRKAYYSNYGTEQTDVSAPGGDRRDFYGTSMYGAPETRILAAYPKNVGLAEGTIDPATGNPTTPLVVKDGEGYYQYIQGTSMAAPHAVGVAADIIGKWGATASDGQKSMDPNAVEAQLRATATDTACPKPRMFTYPDLGGDFNAKCEGTADLNGFYGDGIVNAFRAVTETPGF